VRFRSCKQALEANRAVGSLAFPCPVSPPSQPSLASSFRRSSLTPPVASSSKTHRILPSCGLSLNRSKLRPLPGSSLGVLSKNAPPSTPAVCVHSRLPGARELPHSRARSALAVPPGSSGLLRTRPCRFVAPCSRPWGPPGFEPTVDYRRSTDPPHRRSTLRSFSPSLQRLFPSPRLTPRHRDSNPLVVGSRVPKNPILPRPQGFLRKESAPSLLGVATEEHGVASLGFPFDSSLRCACRPRGSATVPPTEARGAPGTEVPSPAPQPSHGIPCERRGDCENDDQILSLVMSRSSHLANQVSSARRPPPFPRAITGPGSFTPPPTRLATSGPSHPTRRCSRS